MNAPAHTTHTFQAPRTRQSRRLRVGLLSAVASAVGLIPAGCGGSSHNSITTSHTSASHAATSKPASTSASASTSAPQGSALSGKWSGHYSGAYSGTFSLNWTESGAQLSGEITLSSPAETTGITGSVSGGSIKFGTVSGALYNGTVSGGSMSGSYTTANGGGSWSASKA